MVSLTDPLGWTVFIGRAFLHALSEEQKWVKEGAHEWVKYIMDKLNKFCEYNLEAYYFCTAYI